MRQVVILLNLRIQNFLAGKTRAHVCSGVREIEGFWLLVFDKDDFFGCDGGGNTTLLGDLGFFLKLRKNIKRNY